MTEIILIKETPTVSFQVAHVYEHAYILACQEALQKNGLIPYTTVEFNGATYNNTYLYVRAEVFNDRNYDAIKRVMLSDLTITEAHKQQAFLETETEYVSKARIIDREAYEQQLAILINTRWKSLEDQPYTPSTEEVNSPVEYTAAHAEFKKANLTISFSVSNPRMVAVLARLTYVMINSISYHLGAAFQSYTTYTTYLDYNEKDTACFEQNLLIDSRYSKQEIIKTASEALTVLTRPDDYTDLGLFLEAWTESKTEQSAAMTFSECTNILMGSKQTLKEFEEHDLKPLLRSTRVSVSLRKAL